MSSKKLLQQMLGLTLIAFLLVGCGGPKPKVGHWEGEPSVSFDVTNEGNIRDFKIVAPFGGGSECTINLTEDIVIESDGTFTFSSSLTAVGSIENRISGKFDGDTTVTGTYLFDFCGSGENVTVRFLSNEETWSAEWKSP
jgi:hypothetical protein